MSHLFAWLDRVSTPRRFLVLFALEILVLGCENLLDFPLSVPFMRRAAGGHPYLDMCAFCSATQIDAQLDDFGQTGRQLQLLLMPTVDVLIPVLSCAFGSVGLSLLHRGERGARRWIRVLPLAAMALDFTENAGIVALVTAHPARLDGLATLTGLVSGVKFCAYLATVVALGALGIARLREGREPVRALAGRPS